MGGPGYVKLKHAFSAVALRTVEDTGRIPTARVLAAYAQIVDGAGAPVADLAAAAGTTREEVRRLLLETGLFEHCAPSDQVGLAAGYAPYASYFGRQAARLAEAVRILGEPALAGMPPTVRRGAALFNAGLFFECHEYFEDVWRAAGSRDRAFYHGLIQAAAACYHCEKGNAHGTRALAGRAIGKLRGYAPAFRGIDVAALVAVLERLGASGSVAARVPSGRDELPRMAPPTAGAP